MSFLSKIRKQKAVWWQKTGVDKFSKATFAAPVQTACRWTDLTEQRLNSEGETYASKATVFVDRDMKVGDRLQLGVINAQTPSDPLKAINAYEVASFDNVPDIKAKANNYLKVAYVK